MNTFYTMEQIQAAIATATERYENDGYSAKAGNVLAEYILAALAGEKDNGEIIHAGCRIERKTGAELGRRGRVKDLVGWIAYDVITGEEVSRWEPDTTGSVPLSMVKRHLEDVVELRKILKK